MQRALTNHPTAALSSSFSTSPRIGDPRKNRDSLQRRQLWWLPYVVLEFDKNEVLVDALGGDLSSPLWMYSATFDVSRISDIAVTAYLRQNPPSSSSGDEGQKGSGNGFGNGGAVGGPGADMGNSDLCLGTVRFTPDLESLVSCLLFPR